MRARTHVLLAAASLVLLIASMRIPHTVNSQQELAAVPLGYPISFAVQNLSIFDPPDFPRRYAVLSPWNHPIRLLPGRAAASFLCVFAALEIVARTARGWRARSTGRDTASGLRP